LTAKKDLEKWKETLMIPYKQGGARLEGEKEFFSAAPWFCSPAGRTTGNLSKVCRGKKKEGSTRENNDGKKACNKRGSK